MKVKGKLGSIFSGTKVNRNNHTTPPGKRNAGASQKQTPDEKWKKYSKDCKTHLKNGNYGFYRNTRFSMGQMRMQEGAWDDALFLFCEVLTYDVNEAAQNNFNPEHIPYMSSHFFHKDGPFFAPRVMLNIEKCGSKLGLSDDALRGKMIEYVGTFSTPIVLFRSNEVVDMYFAYTDGDTKAIKKTNSNAKKRFKKKHPNLEV